MQEVFEKIIEKLEENQTIVFNLGGGNPKQSIDLERVIEIVKQEAEKFGRDTNVGSNGWIPCSERLPEVESDVLVSLRSLDIYTGFMANTDGCSYVVGEGYVKYENVLAWQPLPEPYAKGE